MIWSCLRIFANSVSFMAVISWPSNSTLPEVASRRRISTRPRVLLPQPDSPTRAMVSPSYISRFTSDTACTTSGFFFVPPMGNSFTRCSVQRRTLRSPAVWDFSFRLSASLPAVCDRLSAIFLFFSSAVITGHLLCLKLLCFLFTFSLVFT